jgi:hypothetical protein
MMAMVNPLKTREMSNGFRRLKLYCRVCGAMQEIAWKTGYVCDCGDCRSEMSVEQIVDERLWMSISLN